MPHLHLRHGTVPGIKDGVHRGSDIRVEVLRVHLAAWHVRTQRGIVEHPISNLWYHCGGVAAPLLSDAPNFVLTHQLCSEGCPTIRPLGCDAV
jgi:hypothetical protein